MRFAPYSYSKIKKYIECPHKFKLSVIDRIGVPVVIPAVIGNIFHRFVAEYDTHRLSAGNPQPIPGIVDRLVEEAKMVTLDRAKVVLNEKQEKDAETLCHDYSRKPLTLKGLVGIEHKWAVTESGESCDFKSPNAYFRGIFDKLYIDGGLASVLDHKTSRKANADRLQVEIYSWAVTKLWPMIQQVSAVFEYDRLNWSDSFLLDYEDITKTDEFIRATITNCENDREFRPRPSAKACRWCPFTEICPAMKTDSTVFKIPFSQDDLNELANKYIGATKTRDAVKEALRDYVAEFGDCEAMGLKFSMKHTPGWKGVNAVDLLLALRGKIGEDWTEAVTVNWNKIRKLREKYPEVTKVLNSLGTPKMTETFTITKVGD